MRDYSSAPGHGGACMPCCQVCVFAFTAFLIVAERTALIYCFVYYLWVGHNYCYAHLSGFTALFLLPGWGPQWLSYLWYLCDGRIRRKSLTWTHILHLGIFRRLWECMCLQDYDLYGEIMQQADVSALRLFEALVVTLPQTLLQTYVLICTDIGIKSPASVCFVVCLLSLAWALVLYARACLLIRPGHLQMTPAAMLCRLVWRISMLGSRFAILMLFTRIFKQWILGVIGVHWLGATFWMVSQQTDIIRSSNRWRLFNLVLGAVHIFLFLNVKYGQSRYRMAGFYLAMFIENAFLLLAFSWLFTMVSWDTVGIPAAVFCSFLIGVIALVMYYRFLHPKSFEIFQSIRHRGIGGACAERGSTLSLEEKVTPTFHRHATTLTGGGTLMDLPIQWEGWKHHHWLLIRLAMKTGDVSKIWSSYGEGGLAGLMGLPEEIHFPDVHHRGPLIPPQVPQISQPAPQPAPPEVSPAPQVLADVPPPKPALSTVIARPVRKAPPTTIQDLRHFPEIAPFQEVIMEESAEEESRATPSERGDDDFLSAAYASPSLSSPLQPDSFCHIDSNMSLTEASSSVASLDIKTPVWSPERRSSLMIISSPDKKPSLPGESSHTLYFSADAQSPSSGSYLGWGSELSPISTYRSPYRIREARFIPSTPRLEARARAESPGPSSVVITPATPGTTPVPTPGGTPGTSTPTASTPGTTTPAASTPGTATPVAFTPGALTPVSTTPGAQVVPLTPVLAHARKQMVQVVDSRERLV
ncbi:XK-related protein 5b isoform X1 [Pseudochaenichthys georgianus]|uniref:XK-related protein 5b isoform X1 n=1 Tax=Pseudochaenichthys georgianus TaxID=52239 RepID=UPI00146E4C04|nr:XK-related protein 5b isoform X1 [Pseudochaenichthys georgianus]